MPTEAFRDAVTHIFPSLGPAMMIAMGYVDLGKWVASVEGGARFGFDLMLVVFLFNLTAILCQYLATRIGTVSGKNLAEICREEYCKSACILLGVQAELSMITSDLTTILGMAHGLNLLIGMDLFTGVLFVTSNAVLLPLFTALLGNHKAAAVYMSMAGLGLVFYVFGVLISQPEIPLMVNGIFPKLSGENVYSLMALLGANIMAHNFYIHSSLVQSRSRNVSVGALFHDHLFAILFIFTGIFLVNYVLMNSAAAVFSCADVVFNYQDVPLLMDQLFKRPIAPIAFCLVLFVSSQSTALTWRIGREVILRYLFGANVSVWNYHVFFKFLSIITALYCAKSMGAEGIYQLLIFCQVILAMLLPSSVIPLFRVASSKILMGSFKVSWHVEILSLLAFLGIFAANVIFTIEMLFGNSSWIVNLRGGMGCSVMVPYAILLLVACTSLGLTLYLAVTPLKSASDVLNAAPTWTLRLPNDQPGLFESSGDNEENLIKYDEDQESAIESTLDRSMETQCDKPVLEFNFDVPDTATDYDRSVQQSVHDSNVTVSSTSKAYQPEQSKSVVEDVLLENLDMVYDGASSDQGTISTDTLPDQHAVSSSVSLNEEVLQTVELKNSDEKVMGLQASGPTNMDKKGDNLAPEQASLSSETPSFSNNAKSKGSDEGNVSGSLSKLPGLGRAARRQLAAILDEFWGTLFDLHGKLTQEASAKRFNVVMGIDVEVVNSGESDIKGAESSRSFYTDGGRGSIFPANSRDYNSPKQKNISNLESSLGVEMGSSSWSQAMQLNTHLQSSYNHLNKPNERPYPNYLPLHSDSYDYQPATIHGYQLASYLKGIGASRNPYSSNTSLDFPQAPNSGRTFLPTFGDQVTYTPGCNELGSSGTSRLQTPVMPRIGGLQIETPFYETPFLGTGESNASSANTKKYHSSPDISMLIAATRKSLMNDGKWSGPIGPRQSVGRMAYEQSQRLNNSARAGVPLPFDELSPPNLHRDAFSPQSSMSMGPKSLWSRQPFEQLFGMTSKGQSEMEEGTVQRHCTAQQETSRADSEAKLLQSFRFCIIKLLKLEGSNWLFTQNGGSDEELIDQVASAERFLHEVDGTQRSRAQIGEVKPSSSDRRFSSAHSIIDADAPFLHSLPNCGDRCVWRASLVVSFGVWCIHRILELALVESRPELWGKYTYVLNHLQGIIEPAFLKPRRCPVPCACLEIPASGFDLLSPQSGFRSNAEEANHSAVTTAGTVLDIIKDIELAVSGRKGRTGTAAGDVAFPKGKENLASVLKRYKRRLLNKFPGGSEAASSRKTCTPAASILL